MLEKGQNGVVWRPNFAPVPIKNLIVEPKLLWVTATSGWIDDDVRYFDKMSLTADVVIINNSTRDLENLSGVVEVYVGQAILGSFTHKGTMKAGERMAHSVTGVIDGTKSKEARAVLDQINNQNPNLQPVAPVMVTGDFYAPLGGPLGKMMTANQTVNMNNVFIKNKSGSPVRLLVEV